MPNAGPRGGSGRSCLDDRKAFSWRYGRWRNRSEHRRSHHPRRDLARHHWRDTGLAEGSDTGTSIRFVATPLARPWFLMANGVRTPAGSKGRPSLPAPARR